jgi:uncharacterized protein YdeI (YjbR/CyaY-like superfamily)
MAKRRATPGVDAYFRKARKWKNELAKLRTIALASPLTEELKWYQPCCTFQHGNVALISGVKEFCALVFFNGALLKDTARGRQG